MEGDAGDGVVGEGMNGVGERCPPPPPPPQADRPIASAIAEAAECFLDCAMSCSFRDGGLAGLRFQGDNEYFTGAIS